MMRWLLTYADMITLMLALFIILFAMSTISRVKVQEFAKLVSAGFDNTWSVNQPPNGGTNDSQSFDASSNVPAIEKQLQEYVQKHNLQKQVQVHMDRRGLVITLLSDKSYYDSGSAELRPDTQKILDNIDQFLEEEQATDSRRGEHRQSTDQYGRVPDELGAVDGPSRRRRAIPGGARRPRPNARFPGRLWRVSAA